MDANNPNVISDEDDRKQRLAEADMEQRLAEALMKQRDEAAAGLVRALLIINGGSIVALLAFVHAVLPNFPALASSAAWSLIVLTVGASAAAAFHLLRYLASWYHQNSLTQKWKKYQKFYFASAWVSLGSFIIGMLIIAIRLLWGINGCTP